jgi:hypothetical protein
LAGGRGIEADSPVFCGSKKCAQKKEGKSLILLPDGGAFTHRGISFIVVRWTITAGLRNTPRS